MNRTAEQRQGEMQGTQLDLARLFRAVWSAKWLIIFAALFLCVLMAAKTAWQVKPRYRAGFGLYVLNKTADQELTSLTTADITASSQLAGSYADAIKSNQYFLERVLENAGLAERYQFGQLRSAVTAEAVSGSQNVSVAITMSKAEDCLRIAHTMAAVAPEILPELVKGSSVRVTSNPLRSASVISADVKGSAKKGFLYGMAAALVLVILFDIFDRRIRAERELRGLFDGRLAGCIPEFWDGKGVLPAVPEGPAAEAWRMLRTGILGALRESGGKIVGITSAEKGTGKSATAVNLAVFFGQLGRRTILVDASMREPRIAELAGVKAGSGIRAYLSKEAQLADTVAASSDGAYDVLPCGAISEDPTKLLASREMTELLRELAGSYDVVLLDLPEAHDRTDAVILTEAVDVWLVVVRSGKTDILRLRETLERLETAGAKRTGYVFYDARTVRI